MTRKICIVTAGHLSTCPRMLKAADALHAAGYAVRVVSAVHTPWAFEADARLVDTRDWKWRPVPYGRPYAFATWLRSGVRHRVARAVASLSPQTAPATIVAAAFARAHRELVTAVLEERVDLIYGGSTGAIAAAAEAGRRSGTPFGVDFEDFHCDEQDSEDDRLSNALGGPIMQLAANGASFVTAGSAAIARACADEFGIAAMAINNVFPLPSVPPADREGQERRELRLYWFSQTIGRNRGLEDIVRAVGLVGRPTTLYLRGRAAAGYMSTLEQYSAQAAPSLRIEVLPPSAPDSMIDECRPFDVGISAEQGHVRNRQLNLPNKALTYPLAGLPVALTDTAGQRPLADDLGEGALLFAPGDAHCLAVSLGRIVDDPRAMSRAREASWEAARRRWHWEHPAERDALLATIGRAIG
jgi:glycosyltransferase involved in cell wall biosynthesis